MIGTALLSVGCVLVAVVFVLLPSRIIEWRREDQDLRAINEKFEEDVRQGVKEMALPVLKKTLDELYEEYHQMESEGYNVRPLAREIVIYQDEVESRSV